MSRKIVKVDRLIVMISYSVIRWSWKIVTEYEKKLSNDSVEYKMRLMIYHIAGLRNVKKRIQCRLKNILCVSTRSWGTTLNLNRSNESLNGGDVRMSCCILHGETVSPLLFWLPLITLSKLLNEKYDFKSLDKNKNDLI